MKTKYIISSVSALLIMLLITPNAISQQRGHHSERPVKEYKKSNRTSKEHTYKKHNNNRENNQKNYAILRESNTSRSYTTTQQHYKSHKNHVNKDLYNNNSHNRYRAEKPHNRNAHEYYRALPNKKAHKFHHNGYEYYHCNNHFYRYDHGYGYHLVESPFMLVDRLPRRYLIKVINGHRHFIANGFYYVPYGHSFIMIPVNYDNRLALSLSFHF